MLLRRIRNPCDPGISRAGFFVWSTGCIGAMSLEYNTLKSQMFRDLARQLHHRPSVRQFLEVANRPHGDIDSTVQWRGSPHNIRFSSTVAWLCTGRVRSLIVIVCLTPFAFAIKVKRLHPQVDVSSMGFINLNLVKYKIFIFYMYIRPFFLVSN